MRAMSGVRSAMRRTPPGRSVAVRVQSVVIPRRVTVPSAELVICISHRGTERLGTAEDIARARTQFGREGYLKLPRFVEPRLLAQLLDAVDRAEYYERTHHGIGVELCAHPGVLTGTLELVCNDSELYTAIADLTACGHIGCFEGRVYRLAPSAGHYDSWHSDVGQDRQIALSINLSRQPFDGGLLQIRKANSEDILSEVANPVPGDAVIFRVHPDYCHRVGSVTGSHSRTVWAGWFRSAPEFAELRRQSSFGNAPSHRTEHN